MSIQVVGSKEWRGVIWDITKVCFLCGKILQNGEQVVHWIGCGGPECTTLPFIPNNPTELMVVDTLFKRGGMAPALDIFFHPDCVPSFCRRILQDWERMRIK